MLAFGPKDIERAILPSDLARGRAVHANGQVVDVDVNPEWTVLVGRVRGTQLKPYQQMVTLRPGKAGTLIHGTCSCPVHTNCKHVAAVLIEAHTQLEQRALARSSELGHLATVQGQPSSYALSPHIAHWLGELEAAGRAATAEDYPPEIRQRLIYVLQASPRADRRPLRPAIELMVASLLKNGDLSPRPHPYTASNIYNRQPARHLRPADHEILHEINLLHRRSGASGTAQLSLTPDPAMTRILRKILATGRCRLGSVQGSMLTEGPPRSAIPHWQRVSGGRQRLILQLDNEAAHEAGSAEAPVPQDGAQASAIVLPLAPPQYLDASTGVVGAIETGLPEKLAAHLAGEPEVTSSEAALLSATLEQKLGALGLSGKVPVPVAPADTVLRLVQPCPVLHLMMGAARIGSNYRWYAPPDRQNGTFRMPMAHLLLDYGGEQVAADSTIAMLERDENGTAVLTPRDHPFELQAAETLARHGLAQLNRKFFDVSPEYAKCLFIEGDATADAYEYLATFDDPGRFLAFSAEVVPQLAAQGWHVTYSDDYPYRIAEGVAKWWADIGDGSGIDWFSFELGIEFDGHKISLAPQIASMVARLPPEIAALALSPDPAATREFIALCATLKLYHALPDGRILPLPGDRLAPMLKGMMELVGPRGERFEDGKLKLHRADAGALAAFAGEVGDQVAWAASSQRLITLGHNLRAGRGPREIAPPPTFKASLRPYQTHGLGWLDFLREAGFGGVLADDMGLGKTVQALAFLSREKAEGRLDKPALIIAPTSVLPNWLAEAERFAPDLTVLALRGPERKGLFGAIPRHDLVLTTYPLLLHDHGVLLKQEFHVAILDEAQAIKNPKASVAKLTHHIKARHRLALTGTPLENNLGEVWSLFQFLSPGLLGDESTFRRTFRTPIEKHGDQGAQAFLTRRLKPFMLRRTKQEVATELPPKTEIVERVRLEGPQRDLYETVRSLMHKKVRDEIAKKGLATSHIIFLDALLKLRQICCDPRLLKMPQARKVRQSAKLDRLMEMIPEMVAEGRRILLFSQFTSMLDLVVAELDTLGIPFVMLTGDTADRAAPVAAFQSGKVPLFLLSLKAGGTGLNLTAADTVIHYDPWWNPAVENQATDRAYRIGQDKPVFVYKLIVEEGIEEAIELLKARKAALADALFAGASKTGMHISESDIAALFAPLGRTTTGNQGKDRPVKRPRAA